MKMRIVGLFVAALLLGRMTVAGEDAPKNAKPKPYPLKTCITDDEKLGSMGAPYVFTHQGREIKLCCKGCLDDFKSDSAKYMKKLADAEKSSKK